MFVKTMQIWDNVMIVKTMSFWSNFIQFDPIWSNMIQLDPTWYTFDPTCLKYIQISDIFHNCPEQEEQQQQSNPKDLDSKCPQSKTVLDSKLVTAV